MNPSRAAERKFWNDGHLTVAGIDEVGRGSLAGPVVAAAVVLPDRCSLKGIRDSKQLTAMQRNEAAILIKQQALAIGIGWVGNDEIDEHGLTWAVRNSGLRALSNIESTFYCHSRPDRESTVIDPRLRGDGGGDGGGVEAVILDGSHNYLKDTHNSVAIIKGDQKSLCVAAASIIAKVSRDNYMELLDRLHPEYGFSSNKGYSSKNHWVALEYGTSKVHRRLFLRKFEATRVN